VEGLLVDPGNPEALAQALVSVLGDQALSRKLGQAGHARVARDFSLDAIGCCNCLGLHGRRRRCYPHNG